MKFIMLIGLPGSGKSSLGNDLAQKYNAEICSSDEMRRELFGDAGDQSNPALVFQELHKKVRSALAQGKSVIYDATNITAKDRRSIMNLVRPFNAETEAVVLATPLAVCYQRNGDRERVVPDEAIRNMYHRFQMPYYTEGFDKISFHYSEKAWENRNGWYADYPQKYNLMDYDQQNEHHSETLGEHLYSVQTLVWEKTHDLNLMQAAILHDCGKPATKRIGDDGQAHYFHHANCGSYQSMFFSDIDNHAEVGALIAWHMSPFEWANNPKGAETFKARFGEEFFNKIMTLHEADIAPAIPAKQWAFNEKAKALDKQKDPLLNR